MADLSRRGWPASLVEIAELIGDAAALRMVALYGGTRIYIPGNPKPDQMLWRTLGETAARLLAASAFANCPVDVPTGRALRSAKIAIIGRPQDTTVGLARELGVTDRYVRRVRNACGDADEPDLFKIPRT